MKAALSLRQAQVAELVARGFPDKIIARETGLAVDTVKCHVKAAARKLPGDGTPRHRLTLWFFNVLEREG